MRWVTTVPDSLQNGSEVKRAIASQKPTIFWPEAKPAASNSAKHHFEISKSEKFLKLVLTRRTGEATVIGSNIHIMVTMVRRARLQIGITAPECVRILTKKELESANRL
jgi:carbon storage regulator CsrA